MSSVLGRRRAVEGTDDSVGEDTTHGGWDDMHASTRKIAGANTRRMHICMLKRLKRRQFVATVNNAEKNDAVGNCPLPTRAQAGYSLPVDIGRLKEID